MKITNNINKISSIYRQWQPINTSGEPAADNAKPSEVLPVDRVTLSEQAFREDSGKQGADNGVSNEKELAPEEKQEVNNLKKRDAEVKAHEQAHMASGGGIVQGGASYEYQTGPDGRMYAVGGEVQIDLSSERTPEATISKMQQVRRAALAPAQPSGTDRAVAAQASQIEAQARMERTQENEEAKDENNGPADSQSTMSGPAAPTPYQSMQAAKGERIDLTI